MAASEEVDLELIAAFMDGGLTGAERERAIKLLGNSEAAFEVYADALRVRADLEGGKGVIAIDSGRKRRPFPWRQVGSWAAAAVVLVAVVPAMRARRERMDLNAPASQITLAMTQRPDLGRTLTGDWDQRAWSVSRGGGSSLVDSTIAFRLGVRAADVYAAVAARDTVRADRLIGEVLGSLDAVDASDGVRAEYSTLRRSLREGETGQQLVDRTAQAEGSLEELLSPPLESRWFSLGRWLGGGELAAGTRTKAFFDDPRTVRLLKAIAERPEISPDDAELFRQIVLLAEQGVSGKDYETIRQHFQTLIRRYGG